MRSMMTTQPDDGFSLVEVIVALFLLGVVAAGALTFFVRGMQTTSHLQRTQNATSIATQAMELARSVNAREVAGVSGLVVGRTEAAVNAAWDGVSVDEMAQTNRVWDPAAGSVATPALPIVRQTTVSEMTYDITTLVGSCFRSPLAGTDPSDCFASKPTVDAVKLYRVIVVVAWDPGNTGSCSGGTDCSFTLSALVDPADDLTWNLSTAPVAYDDEIWTRVGAPQLPHAILENDVLATVTTNPTTIVSNLPGTAASHGKIDIVTAGVERGNIRYTPPARSTSASSGLFEVQYLLTDAQGRVSAPATIRIYLAPAGESDTDEVEAGDSVTIPVLDNDRGDRTTLSLRDVDMNDDGTITAADRQLQISQPSRGSVSVAPDGKSVVYTDDGDGAATVSFSYVAADGLGGGAAGVRLKTDVTTVTVSVKTDAGIVLKPDVEMSVNGRKGGSDSRTLDLKSAFELDGGYEFLLGSVTRVGVLGNGDAIWSVSPGWQSSPSIYLRNKTWGTYRIEVDVRHEGSQDNPVSGSFLITVEEP